jgi:hypothetical protein
VIASDSLLRTVSEVDSVEVAVRWINAYLTSCGVPHESLLTAQELVLSTLTILFTLVAYYLLMGKSHDRKRKTLAEDLRVAQAQVNYLEEKLMLVLSEQDRQNNPSKTRPIRIFMDGAFDLMHYGKSSDAGGQPASRIHALDSWLPCLL